MLDKNNDEDKTNDLHLAEDDYRHLNLPKHENVSIKEVISQLQQSSPQQASEEQASLYPYHIHLAEADTANAAAPAEPSAENQSQAAAAEEAVVEEEEPLAEDPGVLLLPDTIDEVIRIEVAQEGEGKIKLPVDDDGSQELYRIYHNNRGGVEDQPRDLGIPPVEYPLPKTYTTLVAPQQILPAAPEECCSLQVEIKLNTKLLYLGDYCCGYEGGETALYSSNYGWEGGCGCDCGPYDPPEPPTPNYTVIFNNCDGEQWLDITICNLEGGYGDTQRSSYSSEYQQSYDECCTTYRVEIPAEFGLDCECPIVELQTNQLYINSIWDLLYSQDTHFIDCHGLCYELTYSYESGSSSTFETFDVQAITSPVTFSLEPCVCEEPVNISLVNQECEGGTTSGSTYYDDGYNFNFTFLSGDLDHDGDVESALLFSFYNSAQSGCPVETLIELPSGINCACPIEEIVFDEKDFQDYVNDVTNYGSSALTSDLVLNFFADNGFFEDCHDDCYEIEKIVDNSGSTPTFSYAILGCDDCERTELNVSFSCGLVDRFNSWVDNVAPGSFDPFQFFTDNVTFTQVDCNGASFIEVNYTSVDYAVGDGFYKTYDDTLRINLPEGFCIDDFNEVVIDPKVIYEFYQDSCYQFGYDIGNAVYSLLNYDGFHIVNTKTGAEYEANYNSCTYSYELAPAVCEEAICINPVNSPCDVVQEEFSLQANFMDSSCGSGECQTEYYYQTDCGAVYINFAFVNDNQGTHIELNYSFQGNYSAGFVSETTTFNIDASGDGLGCTNPIVNVVFDESDLISFLEQACMNAMESESSTGITGQQVLDFFSQNGYFEDCEGNCFEIEKYVGEQEPVSYSLENCTDCTHTPINVSINDGCCESEMVNVLAAEESASDADKLAYFQNLFTMDYINCNGASFVEFTYFCNEGEDCKYSSFPACEQTVRITVPEELFVYGCNGSGTFNYDISEVLPHNEDTSTLINNLLLNCGFINDFFNSHFTDYCGNISYNVPCDWGTDFLNYLQDSGGKFTADNGICYELTQNDCGDYVLGLGFEPAIMHDTGFVSSSIYEATFLVVDCGDCCEDSVQPFLLGLSTDIDGIMGNEVFVGEHIALPEQYDCDCVIDPCSLNLIYENYGSGVSHVEGFVFDVTCDGKDYDYKYTIDDGWAVTECCENVPVPISADTISGFGLSSGNLNALYSSSVVGTEYHVQTFLSDTSTQYNYSNDLTFNFTYTQCDVDHDGVVDSYLTFDFYNLFNSTEIGLQGLVDPSPINISALQTDAACCSFELTIDDFTFRNYIFGEMFNNHYGNDPYTNDLLNETDILNALSQPAAIFTDCHNNTFVLAENSGNYSLEAYQTSGPVIFDLSGNGINISDAANGVQYDMNNDGVKDQSAWIGDGNGLLVYDADQNHTVSNASEFVLTDHVEGAKTDLEALRLGFDSNHDEVFDQKDAAWDLFGIWQDVNKDAIVDNGEYHTLAQLGIASINLGVSADSKTVESGNLVQGIGEFTWADGSQGVIADVALHYEDIIHNDSTVTDPSVSNPTVAEQVVVAQNDPVVQSTLDQMAHQAAVAVA